MDDKSFASSISPRSSLGILDLKRQSMDGNTTSPSPLVLGLGSGLDFLPLPGPLPLGDRSEGLPGDMVDRKLESLESLRLLALKLGAWKLVAGVAGDVLPRRTLAVE